MDQILLFTFPENEIYGARCVCQHVAEQQDIPIQRGSFPVENAVYNALK